MCLLMILPLGVRNVFTRFANTTPDTLDRPRRALSQAADYLCGTGPVSVLGLAKTI
jgi:hypothetical protein